MPFELPSVALWVVVLAVILGATALGLLAGRALRHHSDGLREPVGIVQGALLGFVALILAFGLSLAVGRYQDRRAATVTEANAIGMTYLRAQTLLEPQRSRSLALLVPYTDATIRFTHEVPGTASYDRTVANAEALQRRLWAVAAGAAAALFLLALYLASVGRGTATVVAAAVLVALLLLITFDLDRPVRGLIAVPDGPLIETRVGMSQPPAATAPTPP